MPSLDDVPHSVGTPAEQTPNQTKPNQTRQPNRNKQLKAEEASFRQARENLLKDLEKRVKAAKTALSAASTALKKQELLSRVKLEAAPRWLLNRCCLCVVQAGIG